MPRGPASNAIIVRAPGAELTRHRGYAPGEAKPDETSNHRIGVSRKTVLTDDVPGPPDAREPGSGELERAEGPGDGAAPIYTAPSAEAAADELTTFETGPWGTRFPTIAKAWRRAWTPGTRWNLEPGTWNLEPGTLPLEPVEPMEPSERPPTD